ncbi:hypothetical protein D9613_009995 [Agrocybe pediades]|uniref:Uncharacterized protein n=1 Tax=Agrocybe pediades TaxID=84607 RepID=A0A8H4VQN2_9AGAR|nr:hypothetical protein D9613_009995 [Agrocybe pediades]
MSTASHTPKRASFSCRSEDQEMLESLSGLSIKGFHDWYAQFLRFLPTTFNMEDSTEANANTPSSTNASLPTPPALKTSHVYLASPERPMYVYSRLEPTLWSHPYSSGHDWYANDRAIPPNAPLLKDLDSFTEGTGHGSFDFPLVPGPEDGPVFPLIFHPTEKVESDNPRRHHTTSSLDLDSLPLPSDPTDAVLAWIEGVSANACAPSAELPAAAEKTPKKRRRSFTQDSETDDRRFRSWSPSIETHFVPPCAQTEEEDPELVVYRTEPDAPG